MMSAEVSFVRLNEERFDAEDEDDDDDLSYYRTMATDLETCTNNIGTKSAWMSSGAKVQRNM